MIILPSERKNKPQTAKDALDRLISGNERYIRQKPLYPNHSIERRENVASGQHPFAIVLGCSDSRVSPVIIFDQGIGDLFEVRVAGNVAGPVEIASIEFAALNLGAPLIFVMGHESCGAVTASINGHAHDIEPIAEHIQESIKANSQGQERNLAGAVKANVIGVVKQLKEAEPLAKLIREGKLDIAGGYYHLTNGIVEIVVDLP